MAWPKSNEPKTDTVTTKLSGRQLQILEDYVRLKGLSSNQEGIRRMIDGAANWVRSQSTPQTTVSRPVTSHHEDETKHHIEENLLIEDAVYEEKDENSGPSLGDFGGRLDVGLPGGGTYEEDSEYPIEDD